MQFARILAVALMLSLGAGAAFAQDTERPERDGKHKEGREHAKGDHAGKHAQVAKRLAEAQKKLKQLKAKQAEGNAEDPERLAEAIARLEEKISEIKAKIAAHKEKHGERKDGKES
ncbi:MAG: hypothetical protein H6839_16625 [Planctomycetes bacterium]|nr:hypothetical protein [Planctomycetota bacterium]